ncbi:MAG: hypothetical protein Q7T80_01500 [Methanoregula sp.]|nr:hypothetical protein [Methanoregula sp.]
MPNCPVCSSDKVYPLLNTWRCKRCKNIWKDGESPDRSAAGDTTLTGPSRETRRRIEPLDTRLEKRLEELLTRSGGKFCITTITWQAGDISRELFRSYLKRCVKNRVLTETKDIYQRCRQDQKKRK